MTSKIEPVKIEPVKIEPVKIEENSTTDVKQLYKANSKAMTYMVIAVITFSLIYYVWYTTCDTSCEEVSKSKKTQKKSNIIPDYNLHEEIEELKNMQSDVLKNVSQSTGI